MGTEIEMEKDSSFSDKRKSLFVELLRSERHRQKKRALRNHHQPHLGDAQISDRKKGVALLYYIAPSPTIYIAKSDGIADDHYPFVVGWLCRPVSAES